ncbi:ECF-type sigma factor [Lysobacter enzymogenes]|uniref:RNA polymerase sigma factor, ECF family n=1 Tax=Lysobacter enzymogenes TaxID=69 RepID=A0A0S2DB55_LYSEN|nr:ECF-type sigma factor [Lysobacter enzymogenes]ALN55762.1 RNA polymerase sigma factor, ECF family [Lysobacter enzymogenes]QCW24761.1 sigma-70 family RNA polymerase sigma factor [Lysobacter enzymogenes]QQQ00788.1 sigma-70 family RNA polymerase sigma factor [Lysobacter enzymogenes]
MGEITVLLGQARAGDGAAWDRVVQLLYADLKRLARRASVGSGGQDVTALVHDCYLRLDRGGADGIESRAHFLSVAATAMRQLLINHARDRIADKRGGGQSHTTLGKADLDAARMAYSEAEEMVMIDAALKRLGDVDERLVRVLECRLFAGLSEEETALALGLPLRSSQRLWQQARERLRALLDA